MKTTDPEIVALAEAWASIEGKIKQFLEDDGSDPTLGYHQGYLEEARELATRLLARGYMIVPATSMVIIHDQ